MYSANYQKTSHTAILPHSNTTPRPPSSHNSQRSTAFPLPPSSGTVLYLQYTTHPSTALVRCRKWLETRHSLRPGCVDPCPLLWERTLPHGTAAQTGIRGLRAQDRACGCTGWSIGAGWMRTGDGGGIDSDETAGLEEGDDVLMRTVWPGGWWI